MQAPTVANEFFQLLTKSKLLSEGQLRKAIERFELDDSMSPETIARNLVRNRVLTPFQAERLLEGRYRGFVIDGYRVREVLGVGGMGCVYIAEDRDADRKVALKVLSSHHNLDPGMLTRLKLEALAGMEIDHPNVIRTYRIDSTGAVNYMVMELLRGVSLHELVALKGPMKWGMACDVFMQVAMGLQAAHKKGIIHRDIKPANILIAADGVTKLLDFGLAKIEKTQGDEFSLAMIFGHDCLGTPDYIAPEQAEDSGNVDETADIYSLGCTFYVALTGRVPFPVKKNSAKIAAHKTDKPRAITSIRRDVPDAVIQILEKMMAKDPRDRFQTAQEVAEALKPYTRRREVDFDFRELVTLRAKQARDRDRAARPGRRKAGNSSITAASQWIGNPSHHLQADIDTIAAEDTPAIRQPAVPHSRPERLPRTTTPVSSVETRTSNVPKGWFLRNVKTRKMTPVTRVKTRIGTSEECEIRLQDSVADNRQCYVEYDGVKWQLHQESRKQPTFINGKPETFRELKHRTKITFSDGTGLELIDNAEIVRQRHRRNTLLIILGMGAIAGIAATVLMTQF